MFTAIRNFFPGSTTVEESKVSSNVLISLPSGRLDILRPGYAKNLERKCIFLDAEATIRRTSEPFQFELAINRVLAEGEELGDELEEFERTFLIDQSICFRVSESTDETDQELTTYTVFTWIDQSTDQAPNTYEFLVDMNHYDDDSNKIPFFENLIYRSMWERLNGADSFEVPDEELDIFRVHEQPAVPERGYPDLPLFRDRSSDSEDLTDAESAAQQESQVSETEEGDTSSGTHDDDEEEGEEDDDEEEEEEEGEEDDEASSTGGARNAEDKNEDEEKEDEEVDEDDDASSTGDAQDNDDDDDDSEDELVDLLLAASLQPQSDTPPIQPKQGTPDAKSPASVKKLVTPDRKGKGRADETLADTSITSTSASSPRSSNATKDTNRSLENITETKPQGRRSLSVEENENPNVDEGPAPMNPADIQTDSASQPSSGTLVCTWAQQCDLFLFDAAQFGFYLQRANVEASLWIPGPETEDKEICWLTVTGPDEQTGEPFTLISTQLGKEQSLTFKGGSITFNYHYTPPGSSETQAYTWLLKFPKDEVSRDIYTHAQEVFARALFDRDNGLGSYEKSEAQTRSWNRQVHGVIIEEEDIEMAEASDEEAAAEEPDDISDDTSDENQDENPALCEFRGKQTQKFSSGSATNLKNSGLAVGYKENLSFVRRGNMIGVFRNEAGDRKQLKFVGSAKDLMTPDGQRALMPTDMMLHQQDTTMILKDPNNPNSLYSLDLPTGKVVEEWKIDDSTEVTSFVPKTKFAQMNPEATFIGTSHNSLYTVDPRLRGNKRVNNQTMSYKSNVDFACAATTESGEVAIGSHTGDIRLYDAVIGRKAKTALLKLKDPVRGVDTTKNGHYMIATCPTYLWFVRLVIESEGAKKGFTGFERSFPANDRPDGFRIELKPEHRAMIYKMGIPISFRKATFNYGPDSMENTVVTSMGPFLFAFNVRKLKLRQVEYTMKRYDEDVVGDGFKWDTDREIVVTMASDVVMERKNKLAKPNRESFMVTGFPGSSQFGGIVQEHSQAYY